MGQRLPNPFPHFVDSAGAPYAGGTLYFYASTTSTPLAVYSDETLSTSIGTSVLLNSAGRPSTAVFLQNVPYKVVLKDADANEIWTADPVSSTDFLSVIITKVGSGSPSGVVAGTAGSSGVLPTAYWDYTNSILYVCTTTGDASTAVWTAINAAAATAVVTAPQGYLTPTSGTPVISSDSVAATAVYYTPFVGNLVPIYNGARLVLTEFTELTLTLAASHALSTIYDVFVFSNSGTLTLVTGPAWSNSSPGTGARGTGAGTTQITRLNGYWVNAVSMTGRNGSTTHTIGANLATYVGSLFIDSTAGQVTCHRGYGQSRKWGIWNAYNRMPILVKAGDATASWQYGTATGRASRNDSANKITAFAGLAEDTLAVDFLQHVTIPSTNTNSKAIIGIGVNSTTSNSGTDGVGGGNTTGAVSGIMLHSMYSAVMALGINAYQTVETGFTDGSGPTFFGTETNMRLTARWMG